MTFAGGGVHRGVAIVAFQVAMGKPDKHLSVSHIGTFPLKGGKDFLHRRHKALLLGRHYGNGVSRGGHDGATHFMGDRDAEEEGTETSVAKRDGGFNPADLASAKEKPIPKNRLH